MQAEYPERTEEGKVPSQDRSKEAMRGIAGFGEWMGFCKGLKRGEEAFQTRITRGDQKAGKGTVWRVLIVNCEALVCPAERFGL